VEATSWCLLATKKLARNLNPAGAATKNPNSNSKGKLHTSLLSNRSTMTTREALESAHRKELKALEGEKRAAIKKAKGTAGKGKKGKQIVAE